MPEGESSGFRIKVFENKLLSSAFTPLYPQDTFAVVLARSQTKGQDETERKGGVDTIKDNLVFDQ